MSREWKPGDVARARGVGRNFMVVRTLGGAAGDFWSAPHGWPSGVSVDALDLRPLVVIDLDSGEDIVALVDAIRSEADERGLLHAPLDALFSDEQYDVVRGALRRLADPKPPKPEEPTGLGAVVEDRDAQYVSVSHSSGKRWLAVADGSFHFWDQIAAVRVLSEGVTP